MLLDARSISDGETLTADVCIVGAGAAGITLAMELLATGLTIIVLEAGGKSKAGPSQGLYQEIDGYYRRAHSYCECGEYDYRVSTALPGAPPSMLPGFEDGDVNTSGIERWSPPTQFGKVYRPILTRADNLRVLLHALAVELQPSSDGKRIDSVDVATFSGRRFTVRAHTTVLAGGGLETTRLLLASRRVHREGIGNHSLSVVRSCARRPPTNNAMLSLAFAPASFRSKSATFPASSRVSRSRQDRMSCSGTRPIRRVSSADVASRSRKRLSVGTVS